MDTIQITLPDGSSRQAPRGITPAEIARQISPRLAEEALVARVSSSNPPSAGAASGGPSGAGVLPPFSRAPVGRGGAGAFSQREAGHRPADRERLLLRVSARGAFYAGGSRAHRDQDARAGRAGHPQRAQVADVLRGQL